MWNSSGVSQRWGGRAGNGMRGLLWREYEMGWMWTGGIMGCGSCSGVNTRRTGCGRARNEMWKLLWREYETDGMWTGGKWDAGVALARVSVGRDVDGGSMGCGSCSGAREDGVLPICGLSTFGARFARSGGAEAHGLRAQKKREGRASPPLTVHPQTQMSAPASCPCPRPGAGAS